MLPLAAAFASGIIAGSNSGADPRIFLAVSLAAALAAVLLSRRLSGTILLLASFAFAGAFSYTAAQYVPENRIKYLFDTGAIASGEIVELAGELTSRPEPSPTGSVMTLHVSRITIDGRSYDAAGNVRLFTNAATEEETASYAALDLRYGSVINTRVNLLREDSFRNPGVASRKAIYDAHVIDAWSSIKTPDQITVVSRTNGGVIGMLFDLRYGLISQFRTMFSTSTAGVLIASLLGDKYFLDKPTADVFREGGTFHVLVISGLHITFIGGLTLALVRVFTRRRIWHFIIATAFLWAFTIAIGADVPVVRASVMFTILLFSHVIHRDRNSVNALGACALILLAWRPGDLFNPSFQLTIVSVAAIVCAAFPLIANLREIGKWRPTSHRPLPPRVPQLLRRFCETLYWRERVWAIESARNIWSANLFKYKQHRLLKSETLQKLAAYVFEGILVSLIVQISMLPLLTVYFHRIAFGSVILNLWVGFFLAVESFAAIAAVAAGSISSALALPIKGIAEISNFMLLSVPSFITELGIASSRTPIYAGAGRAIYFLYFVPLVILAIIISNWKPFEHTRPRIGTASIAKACAWSLAVIAALIIFHPFSAPSADGKLSVAFLDVGQGDAALVTFPNGETMLVDGGGRFDFRGGDPNGFQADLPRIGETVVSEYLWEKGYSRIDWIVGTHSDADHIQGLADVARNFEIGAALFARFPYEDADFAELDHRLKQEGIRTEVLERGDVFEVGGATVSVLHPGPGENRSPNNDSTVLMITYGSRSILLAGDIESAAEAEILASGTFHGADVVKVPHHGSRTSSTAAFVENAQAKFAIIPVGIRSPFGHPHAEVVNRWLAAGSEVLTTGNFGTITVTTDGGGLLVEGFVRRE